MDARSEMNIDEILRTLIDTLVDECMTDEEDRTIEDVVTTLMEEIMDAVFIDEVTPDTKAGGDVPTMVAETEVDETTVAETKVDEKLVTYAEADARY